MVDSDDEDYEHWPELFGTSDTRERTFYLSHHSERDGDGERYVYVPAKAQSEPQTKPPITEDSELYRYVPAREPRTKEPEVPARYVYAPAPKPKPAPRVWIGRTKAEVAEDDAILAKQSLKREEPKVGEPDETLHVYAPAPEQKPNPKVWHGRIKAQVAQDDAILAERHGVKGPSKLCPIDLKNTDLVWVRTLKGELILLNYVTVKSLDGEWKQYPNDKDNWYFAES